MWNELLDFKTVAVLASVLLFWLGAASLLFYFAVKTRSAQAKLASLAISFGVGVLSLALCVTPFTRARTYVDTYSSWPENLMFAALATAGVSLAIFTTLITAHFIALVVRNERLAYGISAALLLTSPFITGTKVALEYRRNEIEVASIKHETEPAIALCCAGNAASCRATAEGFGRISVLKGHRGLEYDLHRQYLALGCQKGSTVDCRDFVNSVGAVGEKYKEDWLYQKACDPKDLYSEPPPRDAEEF